jgi:hypothetical protein
VRMLMAGWESHSSKDGSVCVARTCGVCVVEAETGTPSDPAKRSARRSHVTAARKTIKGETCYSSLTIVTRSALHCVDTKIDWI